MCAVPALALLKIRIYVFISLYMCGACMQGYLGKNSQKLVKMVASGKGAGG